jgi:S-formylglutathione hydrolase FrmB
MALTDILSIIDAEIATLKQARALLAAGSAVTVAKRKPGRPPKVASSSPIASPRKKRVLSPEGRARIAAAAKKRWAAKKKAAAK